MQVALLGHQTAFTAEISWPATGGEGTSGVDWRTHRFPFQASTSGPVTSLPPTAIQVALEVHVTALSVDRAAPEGCKVVLVDQEVPFHDAAMVLVVSPPPINTGTTPTAMQKLAVAHETPASTALASPELGAGCSVHATPSTVLRMHRSGYRRPCRRPRHCTRWRRGSHP